MRSTFLAIILSLACTQAKAAEEGQVAPELNATLLDGVNFSLKANLGKVILIHFWATWCEPCQREMPTLDTYTKLHGKDGFELIAIAMDSPKDDEKVREMLRKFSFKGAFARNAHYKSYGRIWRLPLTFVIDRKGILRKDSWNLKHEMTAKDLEKSIDPLL